jgi:hypothetical protein
MREDVGMRRSLSVAAALVAAAVPAAVATAGEPKAKPPHILELEYSEDYERIGRHHNVYATVKGDAGRVTARLGELRSQGKQQEVAGPQSYWNFRDRNFVRGLIDDLQADGRASVKVKAVGENRTVRKRCDLVLERDDRFGDYAGGDCDRI